MTMYDYRCPYCGCEIDDPDWWDGWDGEGDYREECPECEREFTVAIWTEPVFLVKVPPELERCHDRCGCWNLDGHCGFGEPFRFHPGRSWCTVSDCPLGHPMETRLEGES